MKKMLVAIGMMSATCAFGGVFDDCVYLFEGGLDADGNGLFSRQGNKLHILIIAIFSVPRNGFPSSFLKGSIFCLTTPIKENKV